MTTKKSPEDTQQPLVGTYEMELGFPIPGLILPPEEWVKTGIKKLPEPSHVDWSTWFGRTAPIVLDIGCGNGRFVISSAVNRPDVDHIGLDILPVVIRYATRRGNQRGLSNTRFIVCDGERFLHDYVGTSTISEIHIYHPQPVHVGDFRSYNDRMMQPEFLGLLYKSLTVAGKIYLQTDSRPYWEYMKSAIPELFAWKEKSTPWSDAPEGRTRREIQAIQQKLKIFRAIATKETAMDATELDAKIATLPRPVFASDRRRVKRRN
jgi:tRNA (guanine-N7-)-methyltransferase